MDKTTDKIISSVASIKSYAFKGKELHVKVKNSPKLFLRYREDSKTWVHRYQHPLTKKRKKISYGNYPITTLATAKERWKQTEDLLSKGIDPSEKREQDLQQSIEQEKNIFEHFAWTHFNSIERRQKNSTLNRKKSRYKLLCDYIGNFPIDSITPPQMLNVLQDIQKNSLNKFGKPTDKAERCAGIASEIFVYALARGYCTYDPASMIKSQLDSYEYNHRPAIVQPCQFTKLLRDIKKLDAHPSTINSLELLSLLFVHNGDLRRMKWQDVDLDEGKWYLTPLKGRGKNSMVKEMVIPLPNQAIKILRKQHSFNGHREHVFYSDTAKLHGIISESTANNRLKELGYQDVHCVHGFRASAKTMLQEQLKYQAVLVEMALGHVTKDQNGAAYARFQFYDDRKIMMQHWADYLDSLLIS